jgi:hypothetical protein
MNFLLAILISLAATNVMGQTNTSKPNPDAMQQETQVQREYALKSYLADYDRVEQIMHPLLRVGAPYCSDKRRSSLGVLPRGSSQLSEEDRPAAAALGLDDGLTYSLVLERTPLAFAGVRSSDSKK